MTVDYPDDARLTFGELAQWSENAVSEIWRLEELGVIARDQHGLFPLLPTIRAMADFREAELAWLRAHSRRTARGWAMLVWRSPSRALGWLRRGFEYVTGDILIRIWPLSVAERRAMGLPDIMPPAPPVRSDPPSQPESPPPGTPPTTPQWPGPDPNPGLPPRTPPKP